jgi:hypothetical protein
MTVIYSSARVRNPGSAVLPANATGLERAMADISADELLTIGAELIADQWDPARVQERNMQHLTRVLGVNLWDERWPLAAKRRWLRLQPQFQALRGTRAAVQMVLDQLTYAGNPASLVGSTGAGRRFFLSRGVDPAAHARWVASLPEIRLYNDAPRTPPRNAASFPGDNKRTPRIFLDGTDDRLGFVVGRETVNEEVHTRRAVLIEDGVETPLGVYGNCPGSTESFYLPTRSRNAVGGGFFLTHSFWGREDATPPVVAITRGGAAGWNIVREGAPAKAEPIRVPLRRVNRVAAFAGKAIGRFLTRATAENEYYESWRIIGRGDLPNNTGPVVSFVDHARMGNRPKTTTLQIKRQISRKRGVSIFLGHFTANRFLGTTDPRLVDDVVRAVKAAGTVGDRFLIDFEGRKLLSDARSFNELD